jgi:hypothetical protein
MHLFLIYFRNKMGQFWFYARQNLRPYRPINFTLSQQKAFTFNIRSQKIAFTFYIHAEKRVIICKFRPPKLPSLFELRTRQNSPIFNIWESRWDNIYLPHTEIYEPVSPADFYVKTTTDCCYLLPVICKLWSLKDRLFLSYAGKKVLRVVARCFIT